MMSLQGRKWPVLQCHVEMTRQEDMMAFKHLPTWQPSGLSTNNRTTQTERKNRGIKVEQQKCDRGLQKTGLNIVLILKDQIQVMQSGIVMAVV